MLGGNQRAHNVAVMVVFGALALVLLGWMTWDLATYRAKIRIEGERSTQNHIEYAEEQVERLCGSLGPAAFRSCVYEQIATARDHARSEQDLEAQQQMASLTRVLAWKGGFGLLLGIVSAFLILRTLWTTQEMALDQRQIGEAQVRAYVSIRRVTMYPGEDDRIVMRVTVKNTGQSPAIGVCVAADIPLVDKDGIGREASIQSGILDFRDIAAGHEETLGRNMDSGPISDIAARRDNGTLNISCAFVGLYASDVFGRSMSETIMVRIAQSEAEAMAWENEGDDSILPFFGYHLRQADPLMERLREYRGRMHKARQERQKRGALRRPTRRAPRKRTWLCALAT